MNREIAERNERNQKKEGRAIRPVSFFRLFSFFSANLQPAPENVSCTLRHRGGQ